MTYIMWLMCKRIRLDRLKCISGCSFAAPLLRNLC